ncbi:MarR family transcriptional regulator [Streptomyces sp. YIM S03343]
MTDHAITTPPGPQIRPGLRDSLPHQLRRATQAWTALSQRLAPDLTNPQFAVLAVLSEDGSLDQSALGARAAIDRSTLTPLLDRMHARGLVIKNTDPDNRRRRVITLTPAGRRLLEETYTQLATMYQQLTDRFGQRGLEEFVELLRALADTLEQTPLPGSTNATP